MKTTLFEWTADLATGNALIDAQHKQLFAAAGDLLTACQLGPESQQIEADRTMNFLLDYTIRHFADEEALLQKYAGPEFAAHKRIHDAFALHSRELAAKLARNGATDDLIIEMYTDICEWWISHIRGEDLRMFALMRGQ